MSMWAWPNALAILSADAARLRQIVRSFVTSSIRLCALVLVFAALVLSSQPTLAQLAQFTQPGSKLVGSGAVIMSLLNGTQVTTAALMGSDLNWTIAGTGDFNGDSKSDILWRHISGGVFMNLTNGATVTSSTSMGGDTNLTVPGTGDFNGDGKADMLWRYGPTGAVFMNLMNGTLVTTSTAMGGDLNWTSIH